MSNPDNGGSIFARNTHVHLQAYRILKLRVLPAYFLFHSSLNFYALFSARSEELWLLDNRRLLSGLNFVSGGKPCVCVCVCVCVCLLPKSSFLSSCLLTSEIILCQFKFQKDCAKRKWSKESEGSGLHGQFCPLGLLNKLTKIQKFWTVIETTQHKLNQIFSK